MALTIPEEAKPPKTYEEWAYQRRQQRQWAEEVGHSVSDLFGDLSVDPTPSNCTCAVCYLHGVRLTWPTLEVDRVPRKAPSKVVKFNPGPDGPAFPAVQQPGQTAEAAINKAIEQAVTFTWTPLTN